MKVTWFTQQPPDRPTDGGTAFVKPSRNRVWLCDHCGWLNDPAAPVLCPCEANTVTRAEVAARHRIAVRRAVWPGRRQAAA